MVNPLEQGKCIRFEKIRVVIGDNVSVKNVDFYKTEHDFINDDPFNMPLSQEEKTYPNMTNGNRRTFFQPEPRCGEAAVSETKKTAAVAAVLVIIS